MSQLSYQVAIAQCAYPGNSLEQAGDRSVIEAFAEGLLVATIDGLGHGTKAAEAAIAAAEALREHPSRSTPWLLEHCNQAIRGTRGAAVSVVSIQLHDARLEWAGVGNVSAILLRDPAVSARHETLLTRGGVVGFRMPAVRPARLEIHPYDTLIMTTDGVRGGYLDSLSLDAAPQQIADHVLLHHKRDTDDALVVVLRLIPEQVSSRP